MAALHQLDQSVLLFLNHLGPAGPAREIIIRVIATGSLYVLLAMMLYLALRKPGGPETLLVAVLSAAIAVAIGKTLCQIVARERPFVVLPHEVRHIALIVRPDSFPSIHAVAAFGLSGGVLFGRFRGWGAAMTALATVMIAARVAAGVHWPSDVLGGAAIGLVCAAAVANWRGRRARRRATTDPAEEQGDVVGPA